MQSTAERRMSLLEILCRRKKDSLISLASDLGVSVRTVRNDIQVLACTNLFSCSIHVCSCPVCMNECSMFYVG